ncbi:MAG: hypothetical protein JF888_06275 [Candidatus Dormibacteraeota bacterium]|uniref:Uncharacterized protein n=1 Tax=Candidatus Dormiibacter inghamiae TaxID=3127013 RepID=A0A934KA58_9BACT|nr:hypothetical protein [Candidatus Dormibacteraeota bacterium]
MRPRPPAQSDRELRGGDTMPPPLCGDERFRHGQTLPPLKVAVSLALVSMMLPA